VKPSLSDLETRAVQLGYYYDDIIQVGEPPVWTVVLVDSGGSELTFQAESIDGAIELAIDRMALLSGMTDL